ncbi:MAG: hypothetical protein ACRDCH_03005, partial [Metamycoplasmataceae bacterium]
MKIDLHLHTKKNSTGESEGVIIDAKNFKQKLQDLDVRLAAITNHYYFDKKQYYEFCDENYTLLPGVELDISVKGKRVQANVIACPEAAEELSILLQDMDNKISPIEYKDFVKKFNKEKWIISPDHKNRSKKGTFWSQEDILELMRDMTNALVITDVSNASTLMLLNSNNFNALLGSDVKNWDNYEKDSKDLVNTHFDVSNYNNFWLLLKNENFNIKDIWTPIKSITIPKIEMDEPKYNINNLEFKQGVNIIFGAKRTGKTEILKYLFNKYRTESVFYSSSNKEKALDIIKKDFNTENEKVFEKDKNIYKELLKNIFDYEENNLVNFFPYFIYIDSMEKRKIVFHEQNDFLQSNILLEGDNENIDKNIMDFCNKIKEANLNLSHLEVNKYKWVSETERILKILWQIKLSIWKGTWKQNIYINIKRRVDKLLLIKKGKEAKPSNLGLYDRYQGKVTFLRNFDKIQQLDKTKSIKLETFNIPGRVNVCAYKVLYLFDISDGKNSLNFKAKIKWEKIKKQIHALSIKSNIPEISSKIRELFPVSEDTLKDA